MTAPNPCPVFRYSGSIRYGKEQFDNVYWAQTRNGTIRTKKTGIIFAGCVIASLSSAPLHWVEAIEKGTSEIAFLFSYSRQTVTVEGTEVVDPIHSIVLSSTYGYFLTPMFEPSIGLGGSYMKQGSEDTLIIELMPGLLLNVTTLSDVLVPYAGGRIGFAYVDLGGGEVGFVWNLGGGLRYLVAKNVSLNFEVGYKQYILDTDGKATRLDFIPVSAGISFLF